MISLFLSGLLNIFHSMKETDHSHITFVKNCELPMYQRNWPNHVFAVLPPSFNDASFATVKQVMKVFSVFCFLSIAF